jgi:glycosyltransferase involved in cell wall biosynthesis
VSRLAYLSGAPRVTTDGAAHAGGPRAHVLGVIGGFERAGWSVERYIAGDEPWAQRLGASGREAAGRGSAWRAAAADGVRVASAVYNRVAARRLGTDFALAYERFGSFQSIGRRFQRAGVPWVLETSGPFFHEARVERGTLAFTAAARRTELAAYDDCDLLVCVSEALRDWLVGHGVRGDHVHVMPNAVDTERFDPAAVPASERPAELVIGFVGTVLAWQGLDTVVRAVAAARRRGVDVVAEVVGDGPAADDLRKLAADEGVADAVRFEGQVPADEVPARIAAFDLGLSAHVPLLDGAMYHSPLKLYEYLAMGVPLLAADHPEARRLVEASGAGYLFPAGDAEGLAAVLARAAREAGELRGRREAIRRFAVAEHSWDRRVAELLVEVERRGWSS